jgi:predicted transcriptional regulator
VSQATLTIGVTIRLRGEVHDRLVDHRRNTRVPSNAFIEEAIVEKLDRESPIKAKPRRRKIAG